MVLLSDVAVFLDILGLKMVTFKILEYWHKLSVA